MVRTMKEKRLDFSENHFVSQFGISKCESVNKDFFVKCIISLSIAILGEIFVLLNQKVILTKCNVIRTTDNKTENAFQI